MSRPVGFDDLDAPTWSRLAALLDRAWELPAGEIPAFLERACAGDPTLRARLESLLAADARAGDFLETPLPAGLLDDLDGEARLEVPALPAGARVGAWRIVREIGRGGMGTVFLAERADGAFEQRAAIKLARATVSADARDRFLAERRILARLEHPHIARLLDGGVTADGAPFLAMELVDGEPITAWCEREGAPLRRTLQVFLQVCRAADHAHRNLVVHRDLKPANILVTRAGDAKLLDFGIARLLEASAEDGDPATLTIDRRLTPHYAAPEQIRGEPATTATDVHALGAVLFELLTGTRPFQARASSPAALERAVLEEEPPRPSAVLAGPAAGARQRAWRTRVRGDLDAIVLEAMRKDVVARTPSALAMAEDLERWLEGRPVRARPPTLGDRLRKFVRRNPLASAAAAALLLSLIGGLVAVSWQARRARQERSRAEATRDFALGLFRASDPSESKGDTLSARELLDRGAARVERELRDEPGLQADMLQTLGRVYRELELYPRAQAVLERAVALSGRARGWRHPATVEAEIQLAAVLTDQAHHAPAESLLLRALGTFGRSRAPLRAEALTKLATVRTETGRFTAAESLYRDALAIDEAALGPHSLPVAQILDDLGTLYFDQRRYDRAADCYQRALDIRMGQLGHDAIATANSMENLAAAVGPLGREGLADSLHLAALGVFQRQLGPTSMRAGNVLSNLGAVHLARGEAAAAESAMSEAVRIFRMRLGEDHPETARALNNLAYLHASHRQFARAESLYRVAVSGWSRSLGPDHHLTLHGQTSLAATIRDQGRFAESERMLQGILARHTRRPTPNDMETGFTCHHLGVLYLRTGRYAAAERQLRRVLEIRRHTEGGWGGLVGQSLNALGEVLLYQNRIAESRAACEQAVSLAGGVHDPSRASTLGLGRALAAAGEFPRAESLLREVVAARDSFVGRDDARTLEARAALGIGYAAAGRSEPARELLRTAVPVLEREATTPVGLLRQARAALARMNAAASR